MNVRTANHILNHKYTKQIFPCQKEFIPMENFDKTKELTLNKTGCMVVLQRIKITNGVSIKSKLNQKKN